jgi:deoxycytidylate deaminase
MLFQLFKVCGKNILNKSGSAGLMYDNELQLVAPIAKVLLDKCYEIGKASTCNKMQAGALLELPDSTILFGSSGSKLKPCTMNGTEYCLLKDTIPMLEYLTCPSYCAEGVAMLAALDRGASLEGGKLYTTKFPCRRCKDLIINLGIKEVYFNSNKTTRLSEKEQVYATQMILKGVNVLHLKSDSTLEKLVEKREAFNAAIDGPIMPTEFWLQMMLDKEFQGKMWKKIFEAVNKNI